MKYPIYTEIKQKNNKSNSTHQTIDAECLLLTVLDGSKKAS